MNLQELLNFYKSYVMIQNNGQRKIYQPFDARVPPKGTEIFVGRLPINIYEDFLFPLFMAVGEICEFRLMIDFNNKSRGFAFIKYYTTESAEFAIKKFNGRFIRPNDKIGVYKSVNNCRLFVGNIPKNITHEELSLKLIDYCEGLKKVIMYPSLQNPKENRGFAFIEFETHLQAAMARRKFVPGSLILWGVDILVDWADPLPEPQENVMKSIKKLYIRNLPPNIKSGELWIKLTEIINMDTVERLYTKHDYAFIHFDDRIDAEEALEKLNGQKIYGRRIEVMWARPQVYSKAARENMLEETFCMSLPPRQRHEVQAKKQYLKTQKIKLKYFPTQSVQLGGLICAK